MADINARYAFNKPVADMLVQAHVFHTRATEDIAALRGERRAR